MKELTPEIGPCVLDEEYVQPMGVNRVRLTFSCPVRAPATLVGGLTAVNFSVEATSALVPLIAEVVPVETIPNTYDVLFVDPLPPGAWTTLGAHAESFDGQPLSEEADTVTLGFLPGDVDGSRSVGPLDILALINSINGVIPLPLERTDINRSGVTGPQDILRLIDLINGANTTRPWLEQSLPPQP